MLTFGLFAVVLGMAAPAGGAVAPSAPDRDPTPARAESPVPLPAGFVTVTDLVPTLVVELRYATADNFVGRPLDGYERARPILTRAAAVALRDVQAELIQQGFALKLFDAYRPQRAVVDLIRWTRARPPPEEEAAPPGSVPKAELFARGYLALESAHSRGSAVDVTLVQRDETGHWRELDLGAPFDFFGPTAAFDFAGLTDAQRAHRVRLRAAMERHGFVPYDQEWWHFTLRDEPYPDTYYDFPVR